MPTSPIGSRGRDDAGFTLLEMLTVLAIITLLVGVAPVLYKATVPSARIKAAAQDLISELRSLRAQAQTGGQPLHLVISDGGQSYTLDDRTETHQFSDGLQLTYHPLAAGRDQQAVLPSFLAFYPEGVSTGGYLRLTDGTRAYRIDVHWLTSRIRLNDDEDGSS